MTYNKDWFENWFDSPYYDILYNHRDDEEAQRFIDTLIEYLKPEPGATFLDLACGNGRHSIYLASKGYEVTGIDLSEKKIATASDHESDNLSFFIHDMRNEFRINYFDYTLNFFTSFGYFESEHDNIRVLKNVCKGLKEGGTFVLDFFNANKIKQGLVKEEHKIINNISFKINRLINDNFIIKKIKVEDRDKHFLFEEKVRAITLEQFKKYFEEVCLEILDTFGAYDLSPFDLDHSDRLIIIAKKP